MFLGTIKLGRKVAVESTCCGNVGCGEIKRRVAVNHAICRFICEEEVTEARRVQLYGWFSLHAASDDFSFDGALFGRAISELRA